MRVSDVTAPANPFADLDRPSPLDAALGDPTDDANPCGYAAFLDADERGDLLVAGEHVLDRYGLGAEFVPGELGGRLDGVDRLGRMLRPLFRRDGALALGHGVSNLVGAVSVWTDGDAGQRRWLADLLLDGGRVAAAYTDLDTGNDVARSTLRATVHGDRLVLDGRKDLVNNIGRAQAITLLGRTAEGVGGRSHSLLLLDRQRLPRDRVELLPRVRTAAVRSMYLAGMAFRDCAIPASAVVGRTGGAQETMLRAFQITRAALPSAVLGGMDTQVRTVTDFAVRRGLYGRRVADLPHARGVLAGAFLDLLICDCLATTVCRALHLLPRWTSVYAAAVKYLVPLILGDAVERLGTVLGARSFLRTGRHGIFQKHLRDLPVATLVHAGGTLCQATIVPQVPRLARGWPVPGPAIGPPPIPVPEAVDVGAVFRLDGPLPPLDPGRLALTAAAGDPLTVALWQARDRTPPGDPVRRRCDHFLEALADLGRTGRDLGLRERTLLAGPDAFLLVADYAVVLAAATCAGVWLHNPGHPDPFLRDPTWLTAALDRLAARIGRRCEPPTSTEPVVAELLDRCRDGRALDLVGGRLA